MNKCAVLKYRGSLGLKQGPVECSTPELYPQQYGYK